jgi:hypothetical protein
MGTVLAFPTAPPSSDGVGATTVPVTPGEEKCGELIIFPGTDFARILPALRAHCTAKAVRETD